MPGLPAFDPRKQINHSPHVVILGAGASWAAFPSGDAKTKPLPLLVDCRTVSASVLQLRTQDFRLMRISNQSTTISPPPAATLRLRLRSNPK